MRKISTTQILSFFALLTLAIALAATSTTMVTSRAWLGGFHAVCWVALFVFLLLAWAILINRAFLAIFGLHTGYLEPGSRAEFVAQVNTLFYLLLFNSFIRTEFLPIPLKTLLYSCLGARIGSNSYSPGTLLDPPLTRIGNNSIIGHGATVYAHVIEGSRFALEPVVLGDSVTIGAHAVIMPGVNVGDGAIVSVGAVVRKGTRIPPGERWGGVPARRLSGQ